jgi:hypothetical protein
MKFAKVDLLVFVRSLDREETEKEDVCVINGEDDGE